MKALLCKAYGESFQLVYEELPSPVPGPGEVRIAVQTIGLNREEAGDILQHVVTNQIREKVVLTTRYWQEHPSALHAVNSSSQEEERSV